MPVSAVLFDKDGTLFDFQLTWGAWAADALAHLSEGDESLATEMALALDYDTQTRQFRPQSLVIASTNGEVADVLAGFLSWRTRDEILLEVDRLAESVVPVEAVPLDPLLSQLRALGYGLGIATNDSEAVALSNLDHCRIRHHFDFVAGADSGHGGKPGPGMLNAFARHADLPEAEIAMVGDSLHDLKAGRAAGMINVAVLTGVAAEAELAPFADHVLPDVGHLPDLLSGLCGKRL
jgi:phosphoglycolate phosphatase